MRLVAFVVATLSLVLAAAPAAAKKKPPVCPAASYVFDVPESLGPAGVAGFPDVIEIDHAGNVSVHSSCPAVEAKLKGSKKGDKVSVKWDKEVCDQLLGKPKLKARIAPDCLSMEGKFKAKKRKKVKFTATRPPAVTPVLEPERRNAATVGPEGGSVSAEGSNGVVYTLEIPEFALLEDTEVALTPVAEIPDLPFSGGLAGSVEFEPDGLALLRTATLRIEVPGGFAPPAGTELVGFGSRSGQSFHARIAQDAGDAITVPISHFSGGGAAAATVDEIQELANASLPAFEDLSTRLVEASLRGEEEAVVRDAFDLEVRPRLVAGASSDVQLEQAVAYFYGWLTFIIVVGDEGLGDRVDDGLALAATALMRGIDRANARCQEGADFSENALAALRWQQVAEALFAQGDRSGDFELTFLDRASVLEGLCLRVVLHEVVFPDQPLVGEPSILAVEARATNVTLPVLVTATPVEGVAETEPWFLEVPTQEFAVPFTVVGTGRVQIDVEACIHEHGLDEICDRQSVVRGSTPAGFSRVSSISTNDEQQSFTGAGFSDLSLGNLTEQSNVVFGGEGEPVLSAIGAANALGTAAATRSANFMLEFTTDRELEFEIDLTRQATDQASAIFVWCPNGACSTHVAGDFQDAGVLPAGAHSLQANLGACGSSNALSRGVCAGAGSASYGFSLVLTEEDDDDPPPQCGLSRGLVPRGSPALCTACPCSCCPNTCELDEDGNRTIETPETAVCLEEILDGF